MFMKSFIHIEKRFYLIKQYQAGKNLSPAAGYLWE